MSIQDDLEYGYPYGFDPLDDYYYYYWDAEMTLDEDEEFYPWGAISNDA